MGDPYEILGIKPGASKDEIKAAYRNLVKKYHPDRHQDNPLGELAKEKMQEINEAYEFLMNEGGAAHRKSSRGYSGSSYSGRGATTPEFNEIRRAIDRGDLSGAEMRLNQVRERNAEWHFLFGMLQLRRGWYNEAITNIQTATSMDPGNMEYRNALNSVMNRAGGYQNASYQHGYNDASQQLCGCLSCYCCTDACCDCM